MQTPFIGSFPSDLPTDMRDRILAIDNVLSACVYRSLIQILGLWTHHGVFLLHETEKFIWEITGHVDDMERELGQLKRQFDRAYITHVEIWEFFRRSNVQIRCIPLFLVDTKDFLHSAAVKPSLDGLVLRRNYVYGPNENMFVGILSTHSRLAVQRAHDAPYLYCIFAANGSPRRQHDEIVEYIHGRGLENISVCHVISVIDDVQHVCLAKESLCKILKRAPKICQNCKAPARHFCSACKTTRYCTSSCQANDWHLHKSDCKIIFRFMQFIAGKINVSDPRETP